MDTTHVPMRDLVDIYSSKVENSETSVENTVNVLTEDVNNILRKMDTLLSRVITDSRNKDDYEYAAKTLKSLTYESVRFHDINVSNVSAMLDSLFGHNGLANVSVSCKSPEEKAKMGDQNFYTNVPEENKNDFFEEVKNTMIENKHVITTEKDVPDEAKKSMASLTHVYPDTTSPLGINFDVLYTNEAPRSTMM